MIVCMGLYGSINKYRCDICIKKTQRFVENYANNSEDKLCHLTRFFSPKFSIFTKNYDMPINECIKLQESSI